MLKGVRVSQVLRARLTIEVRISKIAGVQIANRLDSIRSREYDFAGELLISSVI